MYDPQKIWSSNRLPSLPTAALELLKLSRESGAELGDYVRIIRTDPALTARILRAANSSFFSLRSEITAVERAVPLLGATFVTTLALGFSLIDDSVMNGPIGDYYRKYWEKSIIQASAAKLVGEIAGDGCADECFQAGLLVDIGELAMLDTLGEDYLEVLNMAENRRDELCVVENEVLGFDHEHIGCMLAENWKLGKAFQHVINHHHDSLSEIKGASRSPQTPLLQAVAISAAASDFVCRLNKGTALEKLRELTRTFLDFDDDQLNEFVETVRERFAECADMFNVSSASLPSSSELIAEANAHLCDLTLQVQLENASAVQRQNKLEEEHQALKDQNEELQEKVIRDPLTNLYNRKFFDEALRNELKRCVQTVSTVGIIFLDVDRFKQLNDTYGHPFGDYVLRRMSFLLEQSVRSIDTVARYGGEEFVVLVYQPSEDGLRRLAEKIRHQVENARFTNDQEHVPLTVSVGAMIAAPIRNSNNLPEELVKIADEQMYEAKQNGRNQVRFVSTIDGVQRKLIEESAILFSKWLFGKGVVDEAIALEAVFSTAQRNGRIGELALADGLLNKEDVDEILDEQHRTGSRFGAAAIAANKLTIEQVARLIGKQQQDPVAITEVLVERGVLDEQQACELLQEFNNREMVALEEDSFATSSM